MICSARDVSIHIHQFVLLCHCPFATFPEWLYNPRRSDTDLPRTAVCYGLHAVFTEAPSVVVILLGLPPLSLPAASSLFLTPRFPTKFWSPDSHVHLFTFPNHPHLQTRLPLIISMVLRCASAHRTFPFQFLFLSTFLAWRLLSVFCSAACLPCLSFASLDCLLVPNYNAVNLNVGLGKPVSFGRCFCFSARIWLRKPVDLYTHTWQRYVDQNSDGAVWVYGECKTVWS